MKFNEMQWSNTGYPQNVRTGKFFSHADTMTLWLKHFASPYWATRSGWSALQASVSSRQKATEASGRMYYNLSQVEGCDWLRETVSDKESLDLLLSGIHLKQGSCQYDVRQDIVYLPTNFSNEQAAHELGHWTGRHNRLGRVWSPSSESPEYVFEDVVAEIAGALLLSYLCLDRGKTTHASYLNLCINRGGGLTLQRQDPSFFRKAFFAGNEAFRYLHHAMEGATWSKKKLAAC